MTVGRAVVCANAGDSRAILYNSVGDSIVELSALHKPSDPAEQQRIMAAGGQVALPPPRPPAEPPARASASKTRSHCRRRSSCRRAPPEPVAIPAPGPQLPTAGRQRTKRVGPGRRVRGRR